MTKSIFASKTFWVNLISGVVTFFEGQQFLDIIPDTVEPSLLALVFALNIVLRYITSQPVAITAGGITDAS